MFYAFGFGMLIGGAIALMLASAKAVEDLKEVQADVESIVSNHDEYVKKLSRELNRTTDLLTMVARFDPQAVEKAQAIVNQLAQNERRRADEQRTETEKG